MKYKKIGDICSVITDYVANGSFSSLKQNVEYQQHGYAAVIRLKDYRNNFNGPFEYVSKRSYEFLKKTKLMGGEIIISNVGANIGTVFKVPNLKCGMTLGPNSIMIKTKYVDDYYYYLLKSNYGQSLINSIVSGSAQPKFNKTDFKKLEVPVPTLEEQKEIVGHLTTIDNKIHKNNQINDNLGALLTNIFKKYMINDDFEKSNLTQIANYKNGLAMQKYRPNSNEESLPVLKIKELNQGNTDDSSDRCSANLDNSVIANTGDIIFSWSGTLLVKNWTGDKAGLNQHLFKVTSNKYPAWFIYEWTKYHLLRFQAIAAGKATTMGHIKRSDLKSSLVYIPSQLFLEKMDSQLAPIYSQRLNLIKENQQLWKLKQTLLNKYF